MLGRPMDLCLESAHCRQPLVNLPKSSTWLEERNEIFFPFNNRWGQVVTRSQMVIHSPQPMAGSPSSRWAPRTGSLYEETPLFGNNHYDEVVQVDR